MTIVMTKIMTVVITKIMKKVVLTIIKIIKDTSIRMCINALTHTKGAFTRKVEKKTKANNALLHFL